MNSKVYEYESQIFEADKKAALMWFFPMIFGKNSAEGV